MTANAFVVADQSPAFALLADPATHGGAPVTRIDTHGAVVFLAGDRAYKVKRAVRFPFMDFSTLEKRRASCAREVALNGPGAPGLYEGVVAIVARDGALALGGAGEPAEYAVVMRRFPAGATLDKVAEAGGLTPTLLADLAHAVAAAHARAEMVRAPDVVAGLAGILSDNGAVFAAAPETFPADAAADLAERAQAALARILPLLRARQAAGFVRRCHGDLHLRNIVLLDGRPVLFDAIEFNDDIATCDVLYDLAFLLMDLWERGLKDEANAVFNRYLVESPAEENLAGLTALPFFLSLRAGIRAKVECAGLVHLKGAEKDQVAEAVRHHFRQALAFLQGQPPRLVAVGGLSGTGKSTLAAAVAPHLGGAPGALVLRSDVERKRMSGVAETERLPAAAYGAGSSEAVYGCLRHRAALALGAGQSVVVDAVHARREERAAIEAVAREIGVPFAGLWLEAPLDVLVARVAARTGDASDATPEVVRHQAGYELGAIGWHRIDVSAGAPAARAAALAILGK